MPCYGESGWTVQSRHFGYLKRYHAQYLKRLTLKKSETTLEEMRQRSDDYGFWFLDTIVGVLAYLFVIGGVFSLVAVVLHRSPYVMLAGCILAGFGLVLIVLLSIAQMLKDIRLNTRESLAIQRSTLRSENDLGGPETLSEDSDAKLTE